MNHKENLAIEAAASDSRYRETQFHKLCKDPDQGYRAYVEALQAAEHTIEVCNSEREALRARVEELEGGIRRVADEIREEITRRTQETGKPQIGKLGCLHRVEELLKGEE